MSGNPGNIVSSFKTNFWLRIIRKNLSTTQDAIQPRLDTRDNVVSSSTTPPNPEPAVSEQSVNQEPNPQINNNNNIDKPTVETNIPPNINLDINISKLPDEIEPKPEIIKETKTPEGVVELDMNVSLENEKDETKVVEKPLELGTVSLEANVVGEPKKEEEPKEETEKKGEEKEKKEDATVSLDANIGEKVVEKPLELGTVSLEGNIVGEPKKEEEETKEEKEKKGDASSNTLSSPPAPGNIQSAITSIRDIGLHGTVYFYVNQDTNKPLLMSGDINHYFEVKDTEIPCETNLPIQITHNINQTLITPNTPFNANVSINGNLCIGGNVYTITSGHTIDVSNIVHIPPLPDATSTIGESGNTFFQKYFEYFGKIYIDNWSSKIHWYTFYNPDNYQVPRELPTKNANNGITKEDLSSKVIGNWALYQRKINMYIGKITVMGNVLSSPPPFSIDMQMTNDIVTGGGTRNIKGLDTRPNAGMPSLANMPHGSPSRYDSSMSSVPKRVSSAVQGTRPDVSRTPESTPETSSTKTESSIGVSSKSSTKDPDKSSSILKSQKYTNKSNDDSSNLTSEQTEGIELFKQLLHNASPNVKETVLNNISNIRIDTTNTNNILQNISTNIIQPLIDDASERNPSIMKYASNEKLQKVAESLLSLPPESLQKIITQLQQSSKPTHSLSKSDITIQVKISGTLTTSSGRNYRIHHIIFLSYEPRAMRNSIYKVFKIEKDTFHVPYSQSTHSMIIPNQKEKEIFYVQGNFGVDNSKDETPSPFSVLWGNPFPVELDLLPESERKQSKKTVPSLHISHLHIYIGNEPIVDRKPRFFIKIANTVQLYKDSNTPPGLGRGSINEYGLPFTVDDNDVLCDFKSKIEINRRNPSTNLTIHPRHKTIIYDVTIPEIPDKEIPAKKSKTQKYGAGKRGGRRTRRFR